MKTRPVFYFRYRVDVIRYAHGEEFITRKMAKSMEQVERIIDNFRDCNDYRGYSLKKLSVLEEEIDVEINR